MTMTPVDPVLALRDWSLAAVACMVHDDREAQAGVFASIPEHGTETLALLCASLLDIVGELEGQTAEEALAELALNLAQVG